jgi:hypothetical protein
MRRFFVTGTLLAIALLASLTVLAKAQSPEIQKTKAKQTQLLKKSLVPSKEERLKYKDFLKSKNTGLIRLLPREKYDTEELRRRLRRNNPSPEPADLFPPLTFDDIHNRSDLIGIFNDTPPGRTLSPTPKTPMRGKRSGDVRGGGAYYSFTLKTHAYGYSSDLSLERGQFHVGFAGADYGFLTDLGDMSLESVSLDTPTAKPLATYTAVTHDAEARREQRRFWRGVEVDGVTLKSRLPMRQDSTYLVRAINYDDSDVLVAFRVVEVESDGTALILWKLLKRYSTPQVER